MPRARPSKDSLASPFTVNWISAPPQVCLQLYELLLKKFVEAEKLSGKKTSGIPQKLRGCVSIGVNECTRSLERGTAKAIVVVTSERNNSLIQHLGRLALNKSIPVVALPESDKNVTALKGALFNYGIRSFVCLSLRDNRDVKDIESAIAKAPQPRPMELGALLISRVTSNSSNSK